MKEIFMNIVLEKPTLLDIENMQKLVGPEVESGVILYRSDDEIAQNIRSYVVAKNSEKIVGFCALHIFSKKLAEIRSIIVDKNYRGCKIGKNMVNFLINEGKKLHVETIFALTYEREFFKKIGFKEIDKDKLPKQKIWADCIKCKHFPVCNEIAFIKQI